MDLIEQLTLMELEAPCRRDHAGCGVHHAVWEARFLRCWWVRRVGHMADEAFRKVWAERMKDAGPCNGWLGRADVARIEQIGLGRG